ncbi:zeta toxin family protein [Corynebacterium freiburgense]|uniref:zeta toxin family protein n=1 Tax=Corynebacterium freiburgense TaxID=556548 RepID=UPI000683EC24|nr:zeta toxin family protein [Corynebacterium freiburgense]WJZ02134.1 Toxin zeta [Corynebacterium freiburgense]
MAKPANKLTAADFPVCDSDIVRIGDRLVQHFVYNQPRMSRPSAMFIGGQPGSGKSMLVEHYRRALGGAVVVDSDILRQLHPAVLEISKVAPLRFDVLSNGPVGAWCNTIIEHARQHRCNVIIENTFANPQAVLHEARTFVDAGYMVGFLCLAVPSSVSRLGIVNRFRQASRAGGSLPRWTTEAAHTAALLGLAATIEEFISSRIGSVVVTDRQLAHRYRITRQDRVVDTLEEVRDTFFADITSVEQWGDSYGACVSFLLDSGFVTAYTSRLLYNLAWDAEALRPVGLQLPARHQEFRKRISDALIEG